MLSSDIPPNQSGLLGVNPIKLEQFLTAKLAKFVIGRKKTEFCIHSSLVSVLSIRLRPLIDKEDCIYLEDVDDDVFSRFTQFVYSGSYAGFDTSERDVQKRPSKADTKDTVGRRSDSTKSPNTQDLPSVSINASGPSVPCFSFGLSSPTVFGLFREPLHGQNTVRNIGGATPLFGQPSTKLPYSFASCTTTVADNNTGCDYCSQNTLEVRVPSKRKQPPRACDCELQKLRQTGKKQKFMSDFMRMHAPAINPRQDAGATKPSPQPEHFKHVLIGQVRIWTFAREYAVGSLMELACENLIRELVYWVMSEHTFVPIFGELVRFVYGSCTVEGDKLRHVMAQFAACIIEDVCLLEGWHKLMTEVPSFAVDMVCTLADRCA